MTTERGKIPLWIYIREAHRLLWRDRTTVVRFAAPWFALLIVADAVINWAYFPRSQSQSVGHTWPDFLYSVVSMALPITIGAIVAVLLHRHIILPEESIERGRPLAPPSLVTAYLGRTIAMQMYTFGPLALGAVSMWLLLSIVIGPEASDAVEVATSSGIWTNDDLILLGALALLFIPACYLPVRISLALPATAIGSPKRTFRDSWLVTRSQFWRLFGGGVVSYWPFWLTLALTFRFFMAESESQVQFVATSSVQTVALCFSDLIWVAYFSLAYRNLVPEPMLQNAPSPIDGQHVAPRLIFERRHGQDGAR
ncbi:MAG: hypothetical protein AB7U75_09525 [Hyphomicrobiaceae bacterium]